MRSFTHHRWMVSGTVQHPSLEDPQRYEKQVSEPRLLVSPIMNANWRQMIPEWAPQSEVIE